MKVPKKVIHQLKLVIKKSLLKKNVQYPPYPLIQRKNETLSNFNY